MTQIPDLQAFRQQLRRSIDGASFARGLSYFRGQHVVKLNLEEASSSGILVRGKVRGSSYQPYDVALIVDAAANQLKTNACSCPIGGNCKHVVAVGLSAIEAWEKVPGRSTGSDADWRRPLETLLAKRAQVPELPFVLQLRLKRPANRYQAAVSIPWQLEAKPRFDDPAKLAMVDTPYGTRYQVHLSWEAFTQMMASSYGMYGSTTIEEKVVALQGKKRQLFRSVLEAGDQFAPAVTEADIRDMFQA